MGGVDVGGGGGKRNVNSDINMVPFIDLLMVTIAFLLITAVWVTYSRMNANAQIPGPPNPDKDPQQVEPEKILHLHIQESDFKLVWKSGATVVSENTTNRPEGAKVYGDLAKQIGVEWKQHGSHQNPSDKKLDQAVLHTDNRMPFKEIIKVLDALYSTQRELTMKGGKKAKVPVFNMTFSSR